MSGRWDQTPDQYDRPLPAPPTRIVVSGEPFADVPVEVMPWPPVPPVELGYELWADDEPVVVPRLSLLRRLAAAFRWGW